MRRLKLFSSKLSNRYYFKIYNFNADHNGYLNLVDIENNALYALLLNTHFSFQNM